MTGVPGQSLPSQMGVQQPDEGASESAASESQADLIWAPDPAAHRWNTLSSLPECQCLTGGVRILLVLSFLAVSLSAEESQTNTWGGMNKNIYICIKKNNSSMAAVAV